MYTWAKSFTAKSFLIPTDLPVDNKEPTKVLKLEKNLSEELREAISTFLKDNLDVFTWKHSDIEGIDPYSHMPPPQLGLG